MDQHFVIRSSRDHLQPVVNEPSAEPSAETPPVHATTARFTPLLFPVIAAVVNTPQIEDVVQPEPAQATARVQKLQTPRLQPTINVTPVASEPQPLPEGRPHLAQPPPPVRRSIRPTNINTGFVPIISPCPTAVINASDKLSSTSWQTVTTQPLHAGELLTVVLTTDSADSDGNTSLHTAVSVGGFQLTKARENTNAEGGGDAGCTVSVWYLMVPVEIPTGTSVDVTLLSAKTAKAITGHCFVLSPGHTVIQVDGTDDGETTASDLDTLSASGAFNEPHLWIRGSGIETDVGNVSFTSSNQWTAFTKAGTNGGLDASNQTVVGEWRFRDKPGNSGNSTPTAGTSKDTASTLVGLLLRVTEQTAQQAAARVLPDFKRVRQPWITRPQQGEFGFQPLPQGLVASGRDFRRVLQPVVNRPQIDDDEPQPTFPRTSAFGRDFTRIRQPQINAPQIGDEPPPDATPLSVRPTPPRQRPARALTLSPQLEDVTAAPDGDVLTVRPAPLPGKPRASSASPQVADEPVPEPVGVPLVVSRSSSVTPPIPAITITPQGADFTPLPDFHPPAVVTTARLLGQPAAHVLTPQIDDAGVFPPPSSSQVVLRPTPARRRPTLAVIGTPPAQDFTPLPDFHPPSVVTRADLLRRPSAVTLTPQIDDVPDEQIIAQPIARPVPQDSKALVVILTPQFERFIEKADCPRWRADETFDRRQRTDETFDRRQRADEQPERRQRAPEDPGLRECD